MQLRCLNALTSLYCTFTHRERSNAKGCRWRKCRRTSVFCTPLFIRTG